jgi:hypothetical protein
LSQYVPPIYQRTSTKLHIYTSQKTVLLAVFAVSTQNPIPTGFILNLPFSMTSKYKIYTDHIEQVSRYPITIPRTPQVKLFNKRRALHKNWSVHTVEAYIQLQIKALLQMEGQFL